MPAGACLAIKIFESSLLTNYEETGGLVGRRSGAECCGDACWGSSGSVPLMSQVCGTFRAMAVSQAAGMSAGPLHLLAFFFGKIEEKRGKKNEGEKKKRKEKGEKERKNPDARYLRTRISCMGLDSEKQILSWM